MPRLLRQPVLTLFLLCVVLCLLCAVMEERFDDEQRAQFIQFVWGRSR